MRKISAVAPAALVALVLAPSLAYASGGEGGHHINWVYVGSLFGNFVLFGLLMYFLLRKPLASFFSSRAEEIEAKLKQAENERDEARKTIAKYESKIKELESSGADMLERARKEAEYEQDRILRSARSQAERMVSEAGRSIETQMEKARRELSEEARRLVARQAEALVIKSIAPPDADRLADDYIEKLREVKP